MNVVPLVVLGGLLVVLLFVSNRNKTKKAAAEVSRRNAMTVGTPIMTTSGLYATIVSLNPENDGSAADTAVLQAAPGVQFTWALAAVKEAPRRAVAAAPEFPELAERADPVATETINGSEPSGPHSTAGAAGSPAVRLRKPKGRAAEH